MSEVTEVQYQSLGNDLFWTAYHREGSHFERLSWSGYNDGFWWHNVEPTDQFKVTKCKCGKEFRLNEGNKEATELQPTNEVRPNDKPKSKLGKL